MQNLFQHKCVDITQCHSLVYTTVDSVILTCLGKIFESLPRAPNYVVLEKEQNLPGLFDNVSLKVS